MGNNWSEVEWNSSKLGGSAISFITQTCQVFERINRVVGQFIAWLAFAMAITTFVIVVLRYGFNTGSIKAQESVQYMHALLFMLCGAYCFQEGKHVRIDIFYSQLSPIRQAWVNICGAVLILSPVCIFTFYISLEYVLASWSYLETSREPAGLPFIFLLKTVLLVMPAMIFCQALSDTWRNYCFVSGRITYKQKAGDIKDIL